MPVSPISVLTVNVGSSSLKLSLFSHEGEGPRKGAFEKLGSDDCRWRLEWGDGKIVSGSGKISRAADTIGKIEEWVGEAQIGVVAHRVVHGGPNLVRHCTITDEAIAELKRILSLAPEHLPAEMEMMDALRNRYSSVTQVACFDTAFHSTISEAARTMAVPGKFRDAGLRRYGFHGLSYEYLVEWLRENGLKCGRSVFAHLGNGASMAAILNNVSVDTTMGLTPAGGLVMGTRSGDIDPGVFRFLSDDLKLSATEIDRALNHESGLKGVSGGKSDVRDLLAEKNNDPDAALALDVFILSAKKHLCGMAATLGGLDRVVFTGGIGEHSPEMRARILAGLEFLGIRIDAGANANGRTLISSEESTVAVHVVPANEEAAMARIARNFIKTNESQIP